MRYMLDKVFEALKRIETVFPLNKEGKPNVYKEYSNSVEPFYNDFDLVFNALLELQAIKEAKPSEEMGRLTTKDDDGVYRINATTTLDDLIDTLAVYENLGSANFIKATLLKAEKLEKELDDKLIFNGNHLMSGFDYKGKQIIAMPLDEYNKLMKLEKAWEVVKEKNVDVALIRLCKDSGEYNGEITLQDEWWHRKLLTQEEFELIKEMLKNEN